MLIGIGCDNIAVELKKEVISEIIKQGHKVKDFGSCADYPDAAYPVAKSIVDGECDRGILICGTGIGMAITANKVKGVYAAVCHDIYSTQRSILSNNVQIMCMGTLVIGKSTAITLVDTWLNLEFKESPSRLKINKIKDIENKYMEV